MVSVGEADFLESHSFYEDLLGLNTHRTIPAPVSCVVLDIARNCASTSNVFCRNIDNSENGEGEPFQLRKLENRSFWKNEEVTNEGIKFGCLLEYRVVTCRQSFLGRYCDLGEQDGKQFIFHKRTSKLHDVDKILLDCQDDESVHEGLKEALEYYNQKDAMTTLMHVINLINVAIKLLAEDLFKRCNSKNVNKIQLDLQDDGSVYERLKQDLDRMPLEFTHLILVHCVRLQEALKIFNLKDLDKILLDLANCASAHYKHLEEALKYFNPEDVDKILLDCQDDESVHEGLKEALEYYNQKYVHTIQLDFINLAFAHFRRLSEALRCLIPKLPELQAYSACTRLFFIGIRAGTINNERVTLKTMSGEWLDMPLNCRESLVLSTGPVHLQLERPWGVADNNVGGVAVVKYEDGKTTCEGLILKYKPYVISRDEEPVKIQNASGEMIPTHHVFGLESGKMRWKVLFDSGSEAGTGISRELLEELNLKADPEKKKEVEVIGGGSCEFETVQIDLSIRGFHFPANGLVGAVAKDTNLLVGMDVIKKLFDQGYSIGS